jgi:hypothetical protein
LREASNDDGLSIQPSSTTPPPTSTVRNSTAGVTTSASLAWSFAGSVSARSGRCAGRATTSVIGTRSNCDQVWNAMPPFGARS